MRQYNFPKKSLLALLIPTMMCHTIQAHADDSPEPKVHLGHETITISRTPQEEVGETIVTRRELNEQMVQNSQDLVRYNTEVDVAEVGRYGNKGFAIRGVDGNRVAMNVDGVALPTTEANEVFSSYGYMYEGRFNPDTEILGSVSITAGADSVISGSGAMGGSVSYKTKEPSSLIKGDSNLGGYAKVGYTTKNEELLTAAGLAGVYDKAEFLLNYAHREGHELKNHDMLRHNSARMNVAYDFKGNNEQPASSYKSLLYPDPMEYKSDTVLGKFYYHINNEHRVGLSALYQQQDRNSNAYSKNTFRRRISQDKEEVKGYGINYRYQPSSHQWLDEISANYQYQDVYGLADTYSYRDSLIDPIIQARDYRPVQTKTHQFNMDFSFVPIDWGKLGLHQFKVGTTYNKQDYTATMVVFDYDSNGVMTKARQAYALVLPDAKKDNYSFVLSDHINFNERFDATLGLRYDYYKYTPYFEDTTYFGYAETSEQNEIAKNILGATAKFYQDYKNGVYNQKPSFDQINYSGAFNYQIVPDKLTARYKISTGFLAPSVTQMYSAFQGLGVTQLVNPGLKPETSLNHELEFEFKPTQNTQLIFGGYLSDYDDFIYTRFWQNRNNTADQYGCTRFSGVCMASLNLNSAKISGFKLGMQADLSDKLNSDGTFKVFANFHTSKDEGIIQTDKDGAVTINTLAAVPTNFVLGADYVSPAGDWSLHGRIRGILRKKAKDTKTVEVGENTIMGVKEYCPYNGTAYEIYCPDYLGYSQRDTQGYYRQGNTTEYYEYVGTYEHANRSKDVLLFDLYGTKKFGKKQNIILNAGVYNLTDVKYIPWETLRQFSNINTNNMVDADGHGFNRYTAPGRNYALSLTYEF